MLNTPSSPDEHQLPAPQEQSKVQKSDSENETLAHVPVVSGSDTPTIISNTRIIRKEIDDTTRAFPNPKKPLSETSPGDSTEQFKIPRNPQFDSQPPKITSKVKKIKELPPDELEKYLEENSDCHDKHTPVFISDHLLSQKSPAEDMCTIRVQCSGNNYTVIDSDIASTPSRELAQKIGIQIPDWHTLKNFYPEEEKNLYLLEELYVTEKRIGFRDRYESKRFVKKIGTGGIGGVYLVRDELLHKNEILKLYHKQFREHMKEELKNEIFICAKLSSVCPNIVSPNELAQFESGDLGYFARYIEGGMTADATLLAHGPIDLIPNLELRHSMIKEMSRIMSTMCRALAVTHANNVVHRDIKPENMLIDKDGTPYLTDFGMARIKSNALDQVEPGSETEFKAISGDDASTDKSLGSPHFMAPEQALRFVERHNIHIAIDERSDIFAIGASMYYLCQGKIVHTFSPNDSIPELMSKVANYTQAPTNQVLSTIDKPVDEKLKYLNNDIEKINVVICRCLASDPEERFQTAAELADSLESIFNTESSEKLITGNAIQTNLPQKHPAQKILLTITAALALWATNIKFQKPNSTLEKKDGDQKEIILPKPTRLEIAGPEQRLTLIVNNQEIDLSNQFLFYHTDREIDENRGVAYARALVSDTFELKKLVVLQILQLPSKEFVLQMLADNKISQLSKFQTIEEAYKARDEEIKNIKKNPPPDDAKAIEVKDPKIQLATSRLDK